MLTYSNTLKKMFAFTKMLNYTSKIVFNVFKIENSRTDAVQK